MTTTQVQALQAIYPDLPSKVVEFLSSPHKLLIGGQWVDAVSGKRFPTYDPATGQVLTEVAEADAQDVNPRNGGGSSGGWRT
jgi:phenylacetaldehyde dehydrogenase